MRPFSHADAAIGAVCGVDLCLAWAVMLVPGASPRAVMLLALAVPLIIGLAGTLAYLVYWAVRRRHEAAGRTGRLALWSVLLMGLSLVADLLPVTEEPSPWWQQATTLLLTMASCIGMWALAAGIIRLWKTLRRRHESAGNRKNH